MIPGAAVAEGPTVPYPGLRSFLREETEVFFGRDGAVHDMLRRLGEERFLAVLGASGSGKSSLVRTGMLEGLELGLIARAGSWWRVLDIRPGGDPMLALARALCPAEAPPEEVEQTRAFLLGGPRSLVQMLAGGFLQPGENLLLLVDQFEELFRYRDYDGHQEAEAFVALLLESARSREVPVYVTLTMRSEYLGACALFEGLAEAMNRGQYLTPRLGRDQCRAAIEGPAAVCGFEIRPDLVTALLNDLARFAPWSDGQDGDLRAQLDMIGRRADQLPLLQHVLNRMWLRARDRAGDDPAAVALTLEDYTTLGGLGGAIDQHARSIVARLSPGAQRVLEPVFRALTTGSSVAEAVRRPTRLATLVEVCGGDREAVIEVIEAFRAPGRSFLTPPPPVPLTDATVIDISHESLIRQWSDLSSWLEAEARDAESLRRLDEAATREAEGRGELLDGRDLAPLAAWRAGTQLPLAWAARHVPDPGRAFAFLDRSIAEAEERRRKAARGRRVWQVMGTGLAGLAVAALGLLAMLLAANDRLTETGAKVADLTTQAEAAQATRDAARQEAEEARQAMAEAEEERAEAEDARIAAEEARAEADRRMEEAVRERERIVNAARRNETYLIGSITSALGQGILSGDFGGTTDLIATLLLLPEDKKVDTVPALWSAILARAFGRPSLPITLTRDRIDGQGRLVPFSWVEVDPSISPPHLLARDPGGSVPSYVVADPQTGHVLHRFSVDPGVGDEVVGYALSMTGRSALLQDRHGRLMRWEAGKPAARRVLDRAWLLEGEADPSAGRSITRAAFDEETGSIAVEYWVEGMTHVTILPTERAAEAPVWRGEDLFRMTVAALGMPDDSYMAPDIFRLLALRGDELVYSVQESSGPDTHLVGLNPQTGAVRTILTVSDFPYPRATTDPAVVNLLFFGPGPQDCAPPAAGGWGMNPAVGACLASVRLDTGEVSVATTQLPDLSRLDFRSFLSAAPLEPGVLPVMGGQGSDSMGDFRLPPLLAAPDATRDWLPWIEDWTAFVDDEGFPVPIAGQVEVRQDESGISLTSFEFLDNRLFTLADAGQEPAWQDLPAPAPPDDRTSLQRPHLISEDGQRGLVLDTQGRVFPMAYRPLVGARLAASPLSVVQADSCRSGQSGDDFASAPSAGLARIGALLRYVDAGATWALLEINPSDRSDVDRSQNRLALGRVLGGEELELHCPGAGRGLSVIGADPGRGMLVLRGTSGRSVEVWTLPATGDDTPQVRTVTMPEGQLARAAAFPAGERFALLTETGHVLLYPMTGPSDVAVGLSPDGAVPATPLPGATRIEARGNRLLLARDVVGAPNALNTPQNRFALVALVDIAADDAGLRVTHAAALPVTVEDVVAWRPDPEGPLLRVVLQDGNVLRIGLPAAPDGRELKEEVLTLANPVVAQRTWDGSTETAMGLLVSLLSELIEDPPLRPAAACAARVQQELSALARPAAPTPANAQPCDDPAALALLEAIAGDREVATVEQPFTARDRRLMGLAASGDSLALRALLQHMSRPDTGAPGLGPVGARRLLARLAEAAAAGVLPPELADPDSADAEAHLSIARAALGSGDNAGAFRHAWIAEAVLSGDLSPDRRDAARALRLAAGSVLPPADRIAVLRALRDWRPRFAEPAEAPAPDLAADLAALDRIAALTGAPGEAGLLALARLEQEIAQAAEGDLALLRLAVDRLAAEGDWPRDAEATGALARFAVEVTRALDAAGETGAARRVDAVLVGILEQAGDGLPFDDTGLIADYQGALLRLVAAEGSETRAQVQALLRFDPGALRFSLGRLAPAEQLALVEARGAVVAAYPEAAGADLAEAATIFWRAFALDRQFAEARDAGRDDAADLLSRSITEQVAALDYMMALDEAGALTHPVAQDLLSVVTNWAANDLPDSRFRDEAARFDALEATLQGIGDRAERTGEVPFLGYPVWNVANLQDVRIFKRLALRENPDPAGSVPDETRLILDVLGHAAGWIGQARRGEVRADLDNDSFTDSRWTLQIATAIGYAAPLLRDEALWAGTCDRLASHPFDPLRRSSGVAFETLRQNAETAIAACAAERGQAARETAERRAALDFMLGRSLLALSEVRADTSLREKAVVCLLDAAQGGNAIALNNLYLRDENNAVALRRAYHDRVLADHFPGLYLSLSTRPGLTGTDNRALLALLRRSAELGSPEAALILGRVEEDPADRVFWLRVAAQALDRNPRSERDPDRAMQAREGAEFLAGQLSPDLAQWLVLRAGNWKPPPTVDLEAEAEWIWPGLLQRTCAP